MAKEKTLNDDSEIIELTPAELGPILKLHAVRGETVGIEGPPGGGKSELVAQAAAHAGLPLYVSNGELEDTTDGKGLPFRDSDNPHQVVWLKDKKFLTPFPVAMFHDELPRAPVAVQGAKATLLLENRIDDIYLPQGTWHAWAGNRTTDRAGANRVPSIIYNRSYMYALRYCAKAQTEWMIDRMTKPDASGNIDDMDLATVSFLRMKGDEALGFDPALKVNPTPRAWTTVARYLASNASAHFATIAGRLGRGLAHELMSFRELINTLPSIDEVLLNPTGARLPSNTSALFLATDMMAHNASLNNFDALVEYAKRIPSEMQAKFVKDAIIRHPEVMSSNSFVSWGVKFAEVLR